MIRIPYIFGSETNTGLIGRIESLGLGFIVIHEAHLMFHRVFFRKAFEELEKLQIPNHCTFRNSYKQQHHIEISSRILRNPGVLKYSECCN